MDGQENPSVASDQTGKAQQADQPEKQKRSFIGRTMQRVGWLAGGPVDWFGRKGVGSGARLIAKLWQQTRNSPQRDRRFKIDEVGGFDLAATAFSYGMSVQALERHLEQRRRTTFMISYGALMVTILSVVAWVHSAIDIPYTFARVMMIWEFLPFLSLFLLVAFYNALLNFQIRRRRSAGWREFISTEEGFFPR